MHHLNTSALRDILINLGESAAGGKSDLLCRLQVVMEERGVTLEEVMRDLKGSSLRGAGARLRGEGTGVSLRDKGAGASLRGECAGASLRDEGAGASLRDEGAGASLRDDGAGASLRDEGAGASLRDEGAGASLRDEGAGASLRDEGACASLRDEGACASLRDEGACASLRDEGACASLRDEGACASLRDEGSRRSLIEGAGVGTRFKGIDVGKSLKSVGRSSRGLGKSLRDMRESFGSVGLRSASAGDLVKESGRVMMGAISKSERAVSYGSLRGREEEVDCLSPEDSISQIGSVVCGSMRDGFRSDVAASNSGVVSRTNIPGKADGTVARSVLSRRSRSSSVMTVGSASDRGRESVVQRARASAQREKEEMIERLKRNRQRARMEKELIMNERKVQYERQREEEAMKERLAEMELEEEIALLKRDAEDEALRVEAELWNRYEEIDMGKADNLSDLRLPVTKRNKRIQKPKVAPYLPRDGQETEPRQVENLHGDPNSWIQSVRSGVIPKMGEGMQQNRKKMRSSNSILQELTASNLRMCMPKHEVEKFGGRPEHYVTFKQSVKAIMDSHTLSADEKLHYLYQYCTGEPKELVRAALYMDPSRGLAETWECFEEKYGAPELIASEFMEKLFARGKIGRDDVDGMKTYAVALRLTRNVVDRIPYGKSELEHPKTIRTLVAKLPFHMQEKWRSLVQDQRERNGANMSYDHLIKFVDREVRVASDPVYGKAAMEREAVGYAGGSGGMGLRTKARVTVNAVSLDKSDCSNKRGTVVQEHLADGDQDGEKVHGEDIICLHCSKEHNITICKEFLFMNFLDRLDSVKRRRGCFLCLEGGHMSGNCPSPVACSECGRWHHILLHSDEGWRSLGGVNPKQMSRIVGRDDWEMRRKDRHDLSVRPKDFLSRGRVDEPKRDSDMGNSMNGGSGHVFVGGVSTRGGTEIGGMSVLPVRVRNVGNEECSTSAFLDNGSAVSFCTPRLLQKLHMSQENLPEVFLFSETVHSNRREKTCLVTGLIVRGEDEDTWLELPPLYLISNIPVNRDDVIDVDEVLKWEHLADLRLKNVHGVDLMLGSNALAASEPIEVRASPYAGGPYGIKTRLGWTVQGFLSASMEKRATVNRVRTNAIEIRKMMEDAFEIGFEGFGSDSRGFSVEDEEWIKIVEEGCKVVDGHYQIPLPLRAHQGHKPDSRGVALKRVLGLAKRLNSNPQERISYENCVNDMLVKGYAEKVEEETGIGEWYIPHFAVSHPDKPGRVRVVFDCAAKVRGISLNDLLLSGPDLVTHLLDVLLRFREGKLAFTADIEAMFHQIRVPKDQRDYLRFFWWDGGIESGNLCEYRMASHLFGACSSPSVANYALRRIADDNREKVMPSVASVVRDNFYVDDCLRSGNTWEILHHEAKQLKWLCSLGGFRLAKFASNVEGMGAALTEDVDSTGVSKCLGVLWDKTEDTLAALGNIDFAPKTKRELLSAIAKIYDPLGIVAPLVLQGRLLFQCIIRCGDVKDWDSSLSELDCLNVRRWVEKLQELKKLSIPRSVVGYGTDVLSLQLHVFGDASESGHAAVAFIRVESTDRAREYIFVWGRARVNPLKAVTIPRLELVAAKLAACMCQRLRNTLSVAFEKVILWTDSMTVLRYLRNERLRFHSFVANRIADIKCRTTVDQWRYVNSEFNPADEGSRGCSSEKWRDGPTFLLEEEPSWPREQEKRDQLGMEVLEVKKEVPVMMLSVSLNFVNSFVTRYSNWRRVVRGIAWLLRFKEYVQGADCEKSPLTIDERLRAEREIIMHIQRECYAEEYECLIAGKPIKRSSALWKLGVFLSNGVLRVGGRLENADMSYGNKHPIVLPPSHHVTNLIIRESHERVGHLGVSTVLGLTREKYWIVRGYSAVRRELSNCFVCRKVKGRVLEQQMANLPLERVSENVVAFTYTGVDCFGPYYVKMGRGHRQMKRYGVVFTCMTVRAVHLEIAEDLSTDSIIRVIRRFMARRGQVQLFRSDNGTNFVGARRELLKYLSCKEVRERVENAGIKWEMNPPKASHFGGVWERVIRTVRRVLEATLTGKTYSDDTLQTVFCEAEAAINSRPLTIVGNDPMVEPLTPQRLLNMGSTMQVPREIPEVPMDSVKKWAHVQAVANQFWRRWCREYRSELQGKHKWTKAKRNVSVGDVVLVVDETEARCHWPLGRITSVKRSADGLVRSVNLFARGKNYTRPVSKLVLLIEGHELP